MNTTSIQWTDTSWNPIRAKRIDDGQRVPGHYCEKISPGCANCYASNLQKRFGMPMFPGLKGNLLTQPYLDEKVLLQPLRRRKPCKVFVEDMSDLYGEWVPFEWIDRVNAVMALCPHLTFQVLTKRAERMAEYMNEHDRVPSIQDSIINTQGGSEEVRRAWHLGFPEWTGWPLPNVWLGVSAEDQKRLDERVPHLLRCPVAVRFLSLEPLLGEIRLDDPIGVDRPSCFYGYQNFQPDKPRDISWVIVGGESGHGARPCNVEWVRSIVRQCKAAGVACFVKQLGAKVIDHDTTSADHFEEAQCWPDDTKTDYHRVLLKDSKGGEISEWPPDLRVREMPQLIYQQTLTPGEGHDREE